MILPSHHPHLQTIVREMPRPVPAGTHVAALDRCTFRGLTTGRASVSGHGITAPPAREVPEPSLSMPAHSHRRNTRAAPAGDGCAAAAVALPELDGIRLAILGLHTCRGDTVLHMHASGPPAGGVDDHLGSFGRGNRRRFTIASQHGDHIRENPGRHACRRTRGPVIHDQPTVPAARRARGQQEETAGAEDPDGQLDHG
jgi:hypothetical protein